MKVWNALRREIRRSVYIVIPPQHLLERLARIRAASMSGMEMKVRDIITLSPGTFLRVNIDGQPSYREMMIYVNHPIEIRESRVRVRYQPTPPEDMILFYGRFRYRSETGSYLTVQEIA